MGQVTIYLDDEAEHLVKQASAAEGIPVSRWIARLIKEKASTSWPAEVREMAGSWVSGDSTEEVEYAEDITRESL